ncbi:hypothetical protein NMY22_g3172 [Coprinellus aureogranulatus]|nr:hypothetical protein NMY22_g3172 [Coprinellus aureogranulatus]
MTIQEELFGITQAQWLFNDKEQRALRHLPFNVQAFLDVAVKAARAKQCNSLRKINESSFNRTFLLGFDNGAELIAKIPFHIFGPKHYTTSSEVATLDFLRTECDIPVPHIRAWCSRAGESPVGVEYIMYDKIPGVGLCKYAGDESQPIINDPYVRVIPPIYRIQSRLLGKTFSQIGNIYYKEDVSRELRERPLYSDSDSATPNSERFRIGPTINREFWRSGRAKLDLDRGPWPDRQSYTDALASCARACAYTMDDPKARDDYHRMISDFEVLAPHLLPERPPLTLWHPDWHSGNIIVSEPAKSCRLQGLIDWQGASVAPHLSHVEPPKAFLPKKHPLVDPETAEWLPGVDPEKLSPLDKLKADSTIRSMLRTGVYQDYIRTVDPGLFELFWGEKSAYTMSIAAAPLEAITRGDLHGLVEIQRGFRCSHRAWKRLVGVDEAGDSRVPWPLHDPVYQEEPFGSAVSDEEKLEDICNDALRSLGLTPDITSPIDNRWFNTAKAALDEAKRKAFADAPEEKKEFLEAAWPIRDGPVQDRRRSPTLQLCY